MVVKVQLHKGQTGIVMHLNNTARTWMMIRKFNKVLKLGAAMGLTFVLSGCLNPAQTLNERQTNYIGQDASVLFEKMGMPQQEGVVAGTKFYAWTYQNSGSMTLPQYNTGTYSGNTIGTYGSYNTVGTVGYTTYTTTNYNYNCVLRAFVDGRNRVKSFDIDGNIGGCNPLVFRM